MKWITFTQKERWHHDNCRKIDSSGNHYVKWNKPDPEIQKYLKNL